MGSNSGLQSIIFPMKNAYGRAQETGLCLPHLPQSRVRKTAPASELFCLWLAMVNGADERLFRIHSQWRVYSKQNISPKQPGAGWGQLSVREPKFENPLITVLLYPLKTTRTASVLKLSC